MRAPSTKQRRQPSRSIRGGTDVDLAAGRGFWRPIIAFAAVGGATQLLWLTFAPVTSASALRYGVSETAIGWLANVFPLWYVVLAIPAGLALDRWLRPTLAVGAVLTALGACVRVLVDNYTTAMVGQTLVALAQPLVLTAITPMAARYLAERDRAKGIAFASAATFGGMIVAFVLDTLAPLSAVLWIDAAIGIGSAVVLVVALKDAPPFARTTPAGGLKDFASAWRNPVVRRVCLVLPIPFGTFTALTTWGQALLEPAGVTSGQTGVLLLLNVVAGVVGCALVPIWASRGGPPRPDPLGWYLGHRNVMSHARGGSVARSCVRVFHRCRSAAVACVAHRAGDERTRCG